MLRTIVEFNTYYIIEKNLFGDDHFSLYEAIFASSLQLEMSAPICDQVDPI